MSHDVFISYSSKDKPIADGICANLEAAGLRCWIAPRDIAAGDDWPTAITAAIAHSRVMVLIFSANSNTSKDVGREIILAANEDLTIIPFKIDNTIPEPGKQYYLARTHWLEAMNPPTKAHIKALVERVKMIIPPFDGNAIVQSEQVPSLVKEHPSEPNPVVKRTWFRREYLWIGIGLLLIILAVIFWPKFQGMLTPPPIVIPTLATTDTSMPAPTEKILPTVTTTKTPTPNTKATATPDEPYYSQLKTLAGHTGEVLGVAFSPDGSTLASSSKDHTIIIWDTTSWKAVKTLAVFTNQVNCVAFSPDGNTMASGSGMGIILWDTATWTIKQTLKDHTGAVTVLAYSSDGLRLASGSDDKTIILWDTITYSKLITLYDHAWMVWGLAFSPDGHYLASGGYKDSTIMVNDTSSGKRLQTLDGPSGDIYSVYFSPDGHKLASGSDQGFITLWNTTTWKKEQTFAPGNYVAFSPDGHTLAGGYWDGKVTLWDTSSWSSRQTLAGHSGEIRSLSFSPDGSLLASGSKDRTVKIWKLDDP